MPAAGTVYTDGTTRRRTVTLSGRAMRSPPPPPLTVVKPPPAPARGVLGRLLAPFRAVWLRVYYAPRLLQAAAVVVLLAGAAGGAAYVWKVKADRDRQAAVAAGWTDYVALLAGKKPSDNQVEDLREALDRVLAVHPDDAGAVRRKADLVAGGASPDKPGQPPDPELATLFMNKYLGAGKLPEAAREAGKLRQTFPHDWRAICLQAHNAFETDRDRAAAAKFLGELPNPEDHRASRLDVGGLLYSLRLFEIFGKETGPLRGLIVRGILPVYKGAAAKEAGPAAKAQLVECYLEPFADPANHAELAGYWDDVARLADGAVDKAADEGDVGTLTRLAALAPRLAAALAALRGQAGMTAERVSAATGQLNERTRKAWRAVRERAPDKPEAYRGLATLAYNAGDGGEAVRVLEEGLRACGPRADLLDVEAEILRRLGRADLAVAQTWGAAQKADTDPVLWFLAALTANAAGDREKVVEACQNARRLKPDYDPPALVEAGMWVTAGSPDKALAVLRPFAEKVRRDPQFAAVYARAAVEAVGGSVGPLDDLLADIRKAAAGAKRPPLPVVYAALRGALDARPFDAARAAHVAAEAAAVLRETDLPDVRYLMADALARQAEFARPPWPPDEVRRALRAYAELPPEAQTNLRIVAARAWLQLKGLGNPDLAAQTAAPLIAAEADPGLSVSQIETLGAVLQEVKRPADAVRVLSRVAGRPTATAGGAITLALAHHALGDAAAARAALDRAQDLKVSAREEAEWSAANQKLTQETP